MEGERGFSQAKRPPRLKQPRPVVQAVISARVRPVGVTSSWKYVCPDS